jgi:hypothetical protein
MKNKTKLAIKSIVKECLIEILAEGLVGNQAATLKETRELRGALQESHDLSNTRKVFREDAINSNPVTTKSMGRPQQNKYLNSIVSGVEKQRSNHMDNTIKKITNDSLMSELLADTANTTLLEQSGKTNQPSVSQSGDTAAKIADQSDPTELFGEVAGNWANLAFAPSISGK